MSAATLDELFNLVPDAMLVVDADGRIVLANPQAEQLFGYTETGLAGLRVEDLMPAAMRGRHDAQRASYMANPRLRPMGSSGQSLIGQRRDGGQFPVEIALAPIRTAEGQRFLASVRDISETQLARQLLVRARYDKLVARVGQRGLEATAEDEVIASLPGELADTLGVDAVAILSLDHAKRALGVRAAIGLDAALDLEMPWTEDGRSLSEAMAGAQAIITEHSPHSAGAGAQGSTDVRHRSSILVPLMDGERPMGALLALSSRPASFDHDALHCLQSVANLLSSLIQRRRTEEQLAHAQRLEAIGQLTGGIAHDFNNLLTVVSGNLQLLELEHGEAADSREFIASAQRAVASGAALTAKLLAFARRQRLTPSVIEPGQLLGELGTMLRRTLGDLVKLDIDCATNTAEIYADVSQLESALLNLSLNARDAMPRGGNLGIGAQEVEVADEAAQLELVPGRYVLFTISDTGHGMTPEVLAHAFVPFFTTKAAGKGNGLGLSMVYGFARQSGGQVRAESRLGYGTRIELYLPVAPFDRAPAAPIAERSPSLGGHEKILVVEDEAAVRDIAVAFLRKLGYEVLAVADAAAALEQLERDRGIDLLFSDVALGAGMSGRELGFTARALRPGLPILLTSGYEHEASAVRPDQGATLELLRKPYRIEDLAACIRRELDGIDAKTPSIGFVP